MKDSNELTKKKNGRGLPGLRCQNVQDSEMQVKVLGAQKEVREVRMAAVGNLRARERGVEISAESLRDGKGSTGRATEMVVRRGALAVMWRAERRKGRVCMKTPSGSVSWVRMQLRDGVLAGN